MQKVPPAWTPVAAVARGLAQSVAALGARLFEWLGARAACRIAATGRALRAAASRDVLWRAYYARDFMVALPVTVEAVMSKYARTFVDERICCRTYEAALANYMTVVNSGDFAAAAALVPGLYAAADEVSLRTHALHRGYLRGHACDGGPVPFRGCTQCCAVVAGRVAIPEPQRIPQSFLRFCFTHRALDWAF